MPHKDFTQSINTRRLTNHARQSFVRAAQIAKKFKCREIFNLHLLYAIYLEKGSIGSNMLFDLNLSRNEVIKVLRSRSSKSPARTSLHPGDNLKRTILRAYTFAKRFNCPYVGTEHLVYSIVSSRDPMLGKLNLKITETPKDESLFSPKESPANPFMELAENFLYLSKIMNLPEITSAGKRQPLSKTPYIDKFCVNINEEVQKKEEIIIGREKELERIVSILGRKNKNNPLLIGEPGVGKTALVSGLALLIQHDQVPPFLHQKRIMSLDLTQLIAGTSFRGEFESRLKEIIKEASRDQEVILFIDELHNIIGAGNVSGSLDLANMLKPALGRGEIRIVGATTLDEYKKYIEKDAALERRFQPVYIHEPSTEEAKNVIEGIKTNYEKFHNVAITEGVIESAVNLSARYIQNRRLPDKAIDILDETAARLRSKQKISNSQKQIRFLETELQKIIEQKEQFAAKEDFESAIEKQTEEKELQQRISFLLQNQSDERQKRTMLISARDIAETIARISGVPTEKLLQESNDKIKNIKETLSQKIIGQKDAIQKLSHTLLRSQSGLSSPDRPLGSFLFLGPTGVGKTLTAKILAQEFFGSKESLIRIDMSELMEHHSVSSLIGSPAGYVGYGEGGNLTEKVRRNPYSVVLFDEIEKAHPDISNILLQILEDGILTDAQGLRVSFKNTVIILTSNIGTDELFSSRLGFGASQNYPSLETENGFKESAFSQLEKKMKPELLNRLDHVIVFNALAKDEIAQITELEMDKLRQRIFTSGIALSWNEPVIDFLAGKSLALNQGARLVRKNIQEYVENPLAEIIMQDRRKKTEKIALILKNDSIVVDTK